MPTQLSFADHLAALRHSGAVLREAAERAGLPAPVPTCPGWDVRQLVTHQGMVHRWAAGNLRGERDRGTAASVPAQDPPDLLAWFSSGLDELVDTLHATPEDAAAMVFLNDAPPPRRFWARRQAHETTIHSADAVAAALGRWPAASDLSLRPELAADGIDELLCGFITRGTGRINSAEPFTVLVSTEEGPAWTVSIGPTSLHTAPGATAPPDATVSGTAEQLYLGLWNRSGEITVKGRDDLLDLWRAQVRVRWDG